MSLIPAFEIGVWNAWILMLAGMLAHSVAPLLMMKFSQGDSKKRFSEITATPPFNKTEKKVKSLSNIVITLLTVYSIFLPLQSGTIWFYAGLAIFLLGFVARQVNIIPWVTTPLDKPVTAGLYHYSRHPIYLSVMVQVIAVGVASASWFFLVFTGVLLNMMNILVIPEERFCLEKYGDAYREYMNKTPRWIGIPKSG